MSCLTYSLLGDMINGGSLVDVIPGSKPPAQRTFFPAGVDRKSSVNNFKETQFTLQETAARQSPRLIQDRDLEASELKDLVASETPIDLVSFKIRPFKVFHRYAYQMQSRQSLLPSAMLSGLAKGYGVLE